MSMGRKRDRSRAGWPDNLYPCKNGYKYRHPATRKETWMGVDKARAFNAAKKLNALLAQSDDLVARVTGEGKTIKDAITAFRKDDMPEREWADKTTEVYESVLVRIQKKIGGTRLNAFGVRECAEFIQSVTKSTRSRQQFRLVLSWILACAVEKGWVETNPALMTRRIRSKRQRERLTIETYQLIHASAEPWLRNAMDLSLITLLRREDIVSARFTDVRDGALWVVPSKTESTTNVRLRITLTPVLEALIARCRADAILSPFIIHRRPEKMRPAHMRAETREHHTQVLPEQLSRAFAAARDTAEVAGGRPPTFHEIRSLGGKLLRDQGWTLAQVQQLMGHESQEMTAHYMEGHEAPWTSVAPGLSPPST